MDVYRRDEEYGSLDVLELLQTLQSSLIHARARAIVSLALRCGDDDSLVDHVVDAIQSQASREGRIFAFSIAHLGVGGLLASKGARAREAALQLLHNWPEPDRSVLLDFLEAQNLQIR